MTTTEIIELVASPFATAISAILIIFQLRQANRQANTTFEDSIVQQYREIIKGIPIDALLGEKMAYGKYKESLDDFYRYIDFCNEQIFLRQEGRVSKNTWVNWQNGIISHLNRPAFKEAWEEIKKHCPHSFLELRRLEDSGFNVDPIEWNRTKKRQRFNFS